VIAVADPARSPLLLLDTHSLLWSMNNNPKLGLQAKEAIRLAYREKSALVSAITPWEIALLVSKGRLQLGDDVMQWIRAAMAVRVCAWRRWSRISPSPAPACRGRCTPTLPTAFLLRRRGT